MSSRKDNSTSVDNQFMKLALRIARDSEGLTGENPSVGCVVTENNKIISTGVTSFNGRPHAEYNALKDLKGKLKAGTIYITMEPCTHFGKTPPCTDIILKSNIKRVVYGVEDIDKRTSFKAFKKLKTKKIKVKRNVNKSEIKIFYKKYFLSKKKRIPFITGKIACSNDDFIKSKKNKYITNKHSLDVAHLLRYKNQGILISYKTLNSDNPQLNCRLYGLEEFSPKRFILDKYLKSKKKSLVFNDKKRNNTYILHNSNNLKKINFFKSKKVNLIRIPLDKNNKLNIDNIINSIYKKNINTLLVEGGKKLTDSFLSKKLFNEFFLFKSSENLKKNGSIKISPILKKISKNFKKKNLLDTYSNKDRIIRYF